MTCVFGRVNKGYEKENGLLGKKGLIDLSYCNFLEESSVEKSRYRMLYFFKDWDFIDIKTASGEELSVFCYTHSHYKVKQIVEWCESTFAWDYYNDWIVMYSSVKDVFYKEVKDDYENWWMKIPPDEREERFWDSCK